MSIGPKSGLYSRKAKCDRFSELEREAFDGTIGGIPFVWIGGFCGQGMDHPSGNNAF